MYFKILLLLFTKKTLVSELPISPNIFTILFFLVN